MTLSRTHNGATADTELMRRQAVALVLAMAPEHIQMPTGTTRLVEDLGYDSLRLIELLIAVESHFAVHAPSDEPIHAQTLGDVEMLVMQLARMHSQPEGPCS
jgi:acyl carrier protein